MHDSISIKCHLAMPAPSSPADPLLLLWSSVALRLLPLLLPWAPAQTLLTRPLRPALTLPSSGPTSVTLNATTNMRWIHALLRASQLGADLVQLAELWCRIAAEASSPTSPRRELPVSSGNSVAGLAAVAQYADEAGCIACLSCLSRLTPALTQTLGSDGHDPAPLLDLLTAACAAAKQYTAPLSDCCGSGTLLPFSTPSGASEAEYVRRMGRALASLRRHQTPDPGARGHREPAAVESNHGDNGGIATDIGGSPPCAVLVPDVARLIMLRSCLSCACWALWALGCI